ncbi:MAG: hypothetical protein JXA77_05715 [Bacteroidales bacterium]|nr:hypothetical protein [Bacteroidales bacterium]
MKSLGVKISFLHRDEDNFKLFGSKDYSNKSRIDFNLIKTSIGKKLIDGEFFYPIDFKIDKFDELQNEVVESWYELESVLEIILESDEQMLTDIIEVL